MQTSISKRLLAGLLSIVMVLSLFVATPAESKAGEVNKNVATIILNQVERATADGANFKKGEQKLDANGDPVYMADGWYLNTDLGYQNGRKEDLHIKSVSLGDVPAAKWSGRITSVNNGSYNLDPDDKLANGNYDVKIVITPLDIKDWADVTTVQVYLGELASNWYTATGSAKGYEKAEFSIVGSQVIVTFKTATAMEYVMPYEIAATQTPIRYQYYLPTELSGFMYPMFTLGTATWRYCDTTGKFSYVQWPSIGTANADNGDTDFYEASMIISAAAGYNLFFALGTATPVMYDGKQMMLMDPAFNQAGDARKFYLTDWSADFTTAKLIISNIQLSDKDYVNAFGNTVTSIELTREMNFGTGEVIFPADVMAKLPTSFYATVNGEKKEIELGSLKRNHAEWTICTVSGGKLVPMDPADQFVPVDQRANTIVQHYYYAVYSYTDTEDPQPIGNDPAIPYDPAHPTAHYLPEKALVYDLFYAGLGDSHNLLEAYRNMEISSEDGLATYANEYGWVIKFSVNAEQNNAGSSKQKVDALRTIDAPSINFYGYGNNYTAYAYGMGKPVFMRTGTFDFTDDDIYSADPDKVSIACDDNKPVYAAYVKGQPGYQTESPVTLSYFKMAENDVKDMKTGAISVSVNGGKDPEAWNLVPKTVDAVAGSLDLANGIVTDPAEIITLWDGFYYSGFNIGAEVFAPDTEYTLVLAIPVKNGYKLSFTPDVTVNGKKAKSELIELNGKTYIYAEYTWEATDKTVNISKTGATKRAWFGLDVPFAGTAVPKKVELTESAARKYEFVDITWYENGVEFEGAEFAKDKRYTAVITLDASKGIVGEDCTIKDKLVGNDDKDATEYLVKAIATKSTQELVITYEFPACKNPEIEKVDDLIIEVPNGMKAADFYTYVASQAYPVLEFVGGSTGVKAVNGFYSVTGTAATWYEVGALATPTAAAAFAAAMAATYPGLTGYDENAAAAQNFEIVGTVNTLEYNGGAKTRFTIYIHVAGKTGVVAFNANGGTYTGANCAVEQGKAYGFKYDPNTIYRAGYLFAGWYTEAEGGVRVKSATIYDGKVKTLYAHWVKVFTGKVWTVTAKSYSKGRLTVTASKPATKFEGYEFSISADGVNWITVSQAKNIKYFTGLTAGTYQVKVRAYRRDSAGQLVYGAYSKVVKTTVK